MSPVLSPFETDAAEYDFRRFLDAKINPTRLYMLVLYALVRANGSHTIVELGTYRGQTTGVLAAAASKHGGHVWTIDNGHEGIDEAVAIRNVERLGLREYVTFVRGASDRPPIDCPIDFLFVDADHRFEGVTGDWFAWAPRMASGGLVAFHDTTGAEGVAEFLKVADFRGWEFFNSPGDVGLALARKIA
jgi:predicted O-methyltransferase YrrM